MSRYGKSILLISATSTIALSDAAPIENQSEQNEDAVVASKEDDFKLRARFRARLNLPNMGRRVSLVVGADDASDFDDSVDDFPDDGVIGQKGSYRFTQTIRWQTNNY